MLHIAQVTSDTDVEAVRELLLEYQAGLGVDLCFQNFRAELAGLPGSYSPPNGRLLLARQHTTAVGCVALQGIDPSRCEMKRLYVRSTARGLGLGRTLVTMILDAAREIGYREIMLDTLPTMTGAQRLYVQFGFHPIAPYRPNPVSGTQYLALSLTSSPSL
ncbi:MAG TPA: GNAT family N-acetyltransferase [Povalibacter sp.]